MKVTFLGTGTSQGVPFIGCPCPVCNSADARDTRLRSAIWIDAPGASIVIDSGPDFRYQMLRAGVRRLDAIVFTHGHKDHIAGLDDIRPYNFFQKNAIGVYATEETQEALRREFRYIFAEVSYPGIPQIDMHTISPTEPFSINGLHITPIRVKHYHLEVLGFRIGKFTYITDANYIAPEEMEKIKGSDTLVLNALRHEAHISHYTLSQAIEVARQAGVPNVYFTHISHQLGLHSDVENTLPAGMHLAYDGLSLKF
ncbi:MBL fold metallo-hydrolase [Nemorincola caseinilytica]|uniref:MBL fold metallo-hydrolase n=1 Tax=Nemorincola caseinilytica TaxID=2054315 RepID=A0ABP8NNL1_9BACT